MTLADLASPVRTINRRSRVLCEHEDENGFQCARRLDRLNTSPVDRPRCRQHNTMPMNSLGAHLWDK